MRRLDPSSTTSTLTDQASTAPLLVGDNVPHHNRRAGWNQGTLSDLGPLAEVVKLSE
jgi:hypothetical protein